MLTATVSDKGQVVIPAALRRILGIKPGVSLEFEQEGQSIRVRPLNAVTQTALDEGYGMLVAKKPAQGKCRLSDFDVAQAMKAQR
jgi:antitoxin PrlF